jgi:Helix-turn-helix domain of transposase family ISL3
VEWDQRLLDSVAIVDAMLGRNVGTGVGYCRLRCGRCQRVRTEAVPWARPGARQTTVFEDTAAWMAQHTDRTTIRKFLRCSWQTVNDIIGRVVAEQLDDRRFNGLRHLGVDEIGYRRGHQYLSVTWNPGTGWMTTDRHHHRGLGGPVAG